MNSRAFTLIEVVIGVTFMSLVIVGVAGLVLSTLNANRRNIQSVQAVYLAQEGLELMRFVRDSNWLQNFAWDEGESVWGDTFHLSDFDAENVLYLEEKVACPPCFGFSPNEELIDMGNMIFERSIVVGPALDENGFAMDDIYEITARIEWQDRGNARTYELSTLLSDWQ